MEILIIIILILFNGLFSMSEIALISARKSSLRSDAHKGSKSAATALRLAENPEKFLSTVQIGITLIGILTGIYSGDVIAVDFAKVLEHIGVSSSYSHLIAQTSIVILVTYFSIIFGELIPKKMGLGMAEKLAKIVAVPINFVSTIASPFVWLLSRTMNWFIKIFRIKEEESIVTEEEIKMMVQEGADDGSVQEVEQDIVERVFLLGDRKINSIMTYRSDIVWLDPAWPNSRVNEVIRANLFDIYPVANGTLDQIAGVVFLKDLFGQLNDPDFRIAQMIRPAQFFPENMGVYAVLEQLKNTHGTYGLIIDEFGALQGIITLKDVLEALVGAMPYANEEPEILPQKEGGWLVDGQCSFYDFLIYFEMENLYHHEYNTISGLILDKLQHIPKEGEELPWHSFIFRIIDMDGARIDKVLVKRSSEH